jgi:tetratricopeptide (TPR) repeat protein
MEKPMPYFRFACLSVLVAAIAACAPQRQQGLPDRIAVNERESISVGVAATMAAQLAIVRRQYAQAIVLTTAAIRSNQLQGKELAQAYAVRGDAMLLSGSAQRARDDWQKAVELDERNATGLRGLGVIANMQRKFAESRQYFQRAIDADPKNPNHYLTRGILRLEDRRELNLALADFDSAIALNPKISTGYFYRGLVHHLNGRYAVAKADYEKALEINPGNSGARAALGLLEQRQSPQALIRPRTRPNDVVQF